MHCQTLAVIVSQLATKFELGTLHNMDPYLMLIHGGLLMDVSRFQESQYESPSWCFNLLRESAYVKVDWHRTYCESLMRPMM